MQHESTFSIAILVHLVHLVQRVSKLAAMHHQARPLEVVLWSGVRV